MQHTLPTLPNLRVVPIQRRFCEWSVAGPRPGGVLRRFLFIATLALVGRAQAQGGVRAGDTTFAGAVARLSEPGGYFDSDNLISNETSYLHVMTRLDALEVRGGAYIGVGPDQNYSYLAAIRPTVAYMLDIRRDNALQHLLYKALFARSNTRIEYLCHWLGRRVPPARYRMLFSSSANSVTPPDSRIRSSTVMLWR